jgi:hypothetical protein
MGMGGGGTATGMLAGGTKHVGKNERVRAATKKGLRRPMQPESEWFCRRIDRKCLRESMAFCRNI